MNRALALIFIFAGLSLNPRLARAEYSDEVCEDFQKVAGEFIDMEVSGLRWQGIHAKPACLTKLSPQATTIDRIPASDPRLKLPEFLLTGGRRIDYVARRIPGDLIEVIFSYIGKKHSRDVAVKDRFILKMNFGKAREIKGCASWYTEPDHFVMRSQCLQ